MRLVYMEKRPHRTGNGGIATRPSLCAGQNGLEEVTPVSVGKVRPPSFSMGVPESLYKARSCNVAGCRGTRGTLIDPPEQERWAPLGKGAVGWAQARRHALENEFDGRAGPNMFN